MYLEILRVRALAPFRESVSRTMPYSLHVVVRYCGNTTLLDFQQDSALGMLPTTGSVASSRSTKVVSMCAAYSE